MTTGKKSKGHRWQAIVAAAVIALSGIGGINASAGPNRADDLAEEVKSRLVDVSKTAVLQEDGSYKINLSVVGNEQEAESIRLKKEVSNTDVILVVDLSYSMKDNNIGGAVTISRWDALKKTLGGKNAEGVVSEGVIYDILSDVVQDDGTTVSSGNKVSFVFFGGSVNDSNPDYKIMDNGGSGYGFEDIGQAVELYNKSLRDANDEYVGSGGATNYAAAFRGTGILADRLKAADPTRDTRVIFLTDGDPTIGYGMVTTTETRLRLTAAPDGRAWESRKTLGETGTVYRDYFLVEADILPGITTKVGSGYGPSLPLRLIQGSYPMNYFSAKLSVASAKLEMQIFADKGVPVDTIDISSGYSASAAFLNEAKAEGLLREIYMINSYDLLREAFTKIIGVKNGTDYFSASNVVVEDKLSNYVGFKNADVDFSLSVDGVETEKFVKSGSVYTSGGHSVTVEGDTVKWSLKNGEALEKNRKYTLSFSVVTNENAVRITEDKADTVASAEADNAYQAASTGGNANITQSEADTGTFAGKYGYYSNAYARVYYKAAQVIGSNFIPATTESTKEFPLPAVRPVKTDPKPVAPVVEEVKEEEKKTEKPSEPEKKETVKTEEKTSTSSKNKTETNTGKSASTEESVGIDGDGTPEGSANAADEENLDIDGDGIPEGGANITDEENLDIDGNGTPQGGAMLAATGGNSSFFLPSLAALLLLVLITGFAVVYEKRLKRKITKYFD